MTALSLFLFVLSGCGGDDGGAGASATLDCAWLAMDNCWDRHVADIAACGPTDGTTGTFSADGTACDYGDGFRVEFDEPLTRGGNEPAAFDLLRDGQLCARYEDSAIGTNEAQTTLTTESGVLALEGNLSSYTLVCPDGSSAHTTMPLSLPSCESGTLPGSTTVSSTTTSLGISLSLGEEAGGADIEQVLFDCMWP